MPEALNATRCREERQPHELMQEGGLLLIPSKEVPSVLVHQDKQVNRTRPKKEDLKQNRKSTSIKGFIVVNDTSYKVNIGKNENLPIYPAIAKKMVEQLDICLDKWGRVFAVRLDFHQEHYRGDNKLISRFICNFRKKMLKEYGFNEFGYQWARELEKVKAQHYHMVIFFDGKKIKSDWNIRKIAKEVWVKICDGNTLPYWSTKKGKPTHYIRNGDEQAKSDAVFHFSYLAKTRGKSYRDQTARDYSTSQMPKRIKL